MTIMILKFINKLLNKPKKLNPKIFELIEQGNREALDIYISYCQKYKLVINNQLYQKCLLISAEQSHNTDSLYDLGNLYCAGSNGFIQDDVLAIDYFSKAASLGHTEAMNQLAYLYYAGKGVEKDEQTMIEWYEKAAALDNAKAITNLGNIYAKGIGVKQSFQKAKEYFLNAAEKGDAVAMSNLSYLYLNGLGVEKDEKIAEDWLIEARKARLNKPTIPSSINI